MYDKGSAKYRMKTCSL